MKSFCPCCEQWSALPADGGKGKKAHVECVHCGAPLQVEDSYALCGECGRFYRADYETCPIGAHQAAGAKEEVASAYMTEAQQRKAKKGGEFYWQLYIDYQTENKAADIAVEEPESATPASGTNGNGHGAT